MLSPDWEAMFPPPGNPPTNNTTLKRWLYWAHVHFLYPWFLFFIHVFFFFLLNTGRITPEPFFNKVLLSVNNFISWDMGYSLQHYLYYSITFHYLLAQHHMAHDSGSYVSIRKPQSSVLDRMQIK